jgi:hypothetical protein
MFFSVKTCKAEEQQAVFKLGGPRLESLEHSHEIRRYGHHKIVLDPTDNNRSDELEACRLASTLMIKHDDSSSSLCRLVVFNRRWYEVGRIAATRPIKYPASFNCWRVV